MPVQIDIRGDTKKIQKDLKKLSKTELPRATVTALNRTGAAVLGRTAKITAKRTKVKLKSIRKRMPKVKANKRNMTYSFRTFSKPIPVHSQLTPGQLVSAAKRGKAKRRSAGVKWRGKTFVGSFVAPVKSGKNVVIKRRGKSRYPTKTVSIEISRTFNRAASKVTKIIGPKIFRKEFTRSAKFIFSKRR